ncbi:MAG: hypothetical protein LBM98_12435 [Oscillospiraceae bacterium]|nr:hypothetical protein [Oscillospiraceae bacterium]
MVAATLVGATFGRPRVLKNYVKPARATKLRHCEAAVRLRYVERIAAKQSSAGSVTYVSTDCGTGLPRAYT